MTAIAVSTDEVTLYYSAIVIAFGIASCFLLTYSLYTARGGKGIAICIYAPLALILSLLLSRIIHWYCHTEQYAGFLSAITDFGTGDFVLSGALVGTATAALITGLIGLGDAPRILDCTAPGFTVAIAATRLSCLFNTSCISKIVIENPALQQLPLAYAYTDATGTTSYRFATFFMELPALLLLFVGLCIFHIRNDKRPAKNGRSNSGSTAIMFLVWYGMIELVFDSTRYDSSFAHFNGFVSIVQMVCAISMIGAIVFYSVRAVRPGKPKLKHIALWVGFFLALAVTGVSEYMVQRHGDWYRSCYATMSLGCFLMAFTCSIMYRLQCSVTNNQ